MEALVAGVFGKSWEFLEILMGGPAKLRLGEFTFDSRSRQLVRGDRDVHLSPKAFELLKVLIDERPRVLSKDELFQHLWPDTFVADVNLASLVAELREALGDHARQPRFIRTAHRVGYGFCGEATGLTDQPADSTAPSFCWLLRDGRRIPLRAGENILGRDEDGIQIDSPTVSRRHARISIDGTTAVIDDLGSKNGTFVGGEPVAGSVALKDGDEIRTGSVVFRFRMTLPKGATATWSGPDPRS
jgi:DNA-binding winged helix-turn-helix (wHTH) protein